MTLPKVAPLQLFCWPRCPGAFRPPFGASEANCGNQTTYLLRPF